MSHTTYEARIIKLGNDLHRRSNFIAEVARKTRESITPELLADFKQAALGAAFEAFLDLGGNPERPEDFDWDLHEKELFTRGMAAFRKDMMGAGSDYVQFRKRYRIRKHHISSSGGTWTQWERMLEATDTDVDKHELEKESRRESAVTLGYRPYIPDQELYLHERHLEKLEGALREVLTSQQADLMIAHLVQDVRQIDLARQRLQARGVSEPTDEQLRLEENAVNQNLSRARRRAAKLLDPSWRDYMRVAA